MPPERKPRVFLDTNVLFSGLVSPGGTVGRVLDLGTVRAFESVISSAVISELARNIATKAPQLREQTSLLFEALEPEVLPNPPAEKARRWEAEGVANDGIILAAAIEADVDYLCTGDRGIHALKTELADEGLKILSPRKLVEMLENK